MQDENINSEKYYIEGVISGFEEKSAVIITNDGQKILWPIQNLPPNCNRDDLVKIVLLNSLHEEEEKQKMAKIILNKILKTDTKANGN